MKDFESSLPQGFYEPIKQTVKTMNNSRKGVKAGDKKIVDLGVICSCIKVCKSRL